MDLKNLTDEQLDAHRVEVLTEIERRTQLAAFPTELSTLAQRGRDLGVPEAEILEAVSKPVEVPNE